MKNLKSALSLFISAVIILGCLTACGEKNDEKGSPLDSKNPTTVTIWNYYNGDQLAAFDSLVQEYNSTVGKEKGIVVTSVSQGSIENLATALLESVNGTVGAADVPSAAAIYSESAYILQSNDAIVAIDDYFTEDELAEYVTGFIDEGRLTDSGDVMLLPVSKSTEAFIANTTDWQAFADATGITAESIETFEDLTVAAEAYYKWTDSLTPDVHNDGKALYGRDSLANYMYVGAKQLGHEFFTVNDDGKVNVDLDKDTVRTLWNNYYIPFVNGYFAAESSYRSEDVKTGTVISMTGSTSSISYIPTFVTEADDSTHDITISVAKSLHFADAVENVSVQQGAGYCIMKTSETEQYAAAEFLKWFTEADQNLNFSVTSGYSPVKTAANNPEKIKDIFKVETAKEQNMLNALLVSADVYANDKTYTCRAFEGSKDIRYIIEDAISNVCKNDRAAVLEAIASGKTRDEALAEYISDAHFDAWFANFCEQVNAAIK